MIHAFTTEYEAGMVDVIKTECEISYVYDPRKGGDRPPLSKIVAVMKRNVIYK